MPTLKNGLVDVDSLIMYLHRNPLSVPLYRTPGWKYHHINHPESSFKQRSLKVDERDPRLVAFRNSPYQQLHMRVSSEIVYHDAHDIDVPHPPMETVDLALQDFETIDMLGAACLYLNLTKGSRQYGIDYGSFMPPWAEQIALKDKVDFISEVREDHARSLVKAEILPERLITSGVKRLAIHLRDPYLDAFADYRLASDPVFYPVKVPSPKSLLAKVNKLMAIEFMSRQSQEKVAQDEVIQEAVAA